MKITRRQLRQLIKEAALGDEISKAAEDALKTKIKDEGGAMGGEEAQEEAEAAANVDMTDEEFEAFANSIGIKMHDDGDVVDVTGLEGRS